MANWCVMCENFDDIEQLGFFQWLELLSNE